MSIDKLQANCRVCKKRFGMDEHQVPAMCSSECKKYWEENQFDYFVELLSGIAKLISDRILIHQKLKTMTMTMISDGSEVYFMVNK